MRLFSTESFFLLITTFFIVTSCGKKSDTTTDDESVVDDVSNMAESAMSEAGAQSSASEGASAPTSIVVMDETTSLLSDYINPEDALKSQSACSYSTAKTCSGSIGTIDWNSCSISGSSTVSLVMSGGWTETYSNSSLCSSGNLLSGSTNDFIDRASSKQVMTISGGTLSGAKVTTDTAGGTAYDSTVIPDGAIRITKTGTTSRTIAGHPSNAGIHKVMTGPRGREWYDYYVVPNLTVTGTRTGTDRTITGTVSIYHNLLKYTGVHTLNSVKYGTATCCYPTSGSISSAFTGTITGTSTLTFSTTCGSATFVGTDGDSSTKTLTNCQ